MIHFISWEVSTRAKHLFLNFGSVKSRIQIWRVNNDLRLEVALNAGLSMAVVLLFLIYWLL